MSGSFLFGHFFGLFTAVKWCWSFEVFFKLWIAIPSFPPCRDRWSLKVFGVFLHNSRNVFLSSSAAGWPAQCLVVTSFFFRTFKMVVLAIPNAWAVALINVQTFFKLFQAFRSFTMGYFFSHRQLSGLHVGLFFFTNKCILHRWNSRLKPRSDIQSYSLFKRAIWQDTPGQQEAPVSHVIQYFCSTEWWTEGVGSLKKVPCSMLFNTSRCK